MKNSGVQVLSLRTRTHGVVVMASTPYISHLFLRLSTHFSPSRREIEELEMGFLCGSFG